VFGEPPGAKPEPPEAALAELPPVASDSVLVFEHETGKTSSAVATADGTVHVLVRRRRSFTGPTGAS
jgi:hypothetical protein